MRRAFWISTIVCGLIGAIHTGFTFVAFDHLSQSALYFAGTGIGTIVLVLFNVAVLGAKTPPVHTRLLLNSANTLMTVFGLVAVSVVPEPQAFVGLAGLLGLAVTGIVLHRRASASTRLAFRSAAK